VHLQQEKRKREKVLINALAERNYELFKGASQQLIKEIETQEYFLDGDDFLLLYQLNDMLHHHIETDNFSINKIWLEKSWLYLNAFYEDTGTQIEAENIGNQNFLNQKRIAANNNKNQLKNLFSSTIDLHKHKQTEYYFQLKEQVLKNWDNLKTKHKINLLVHLLNFTFTNELIQKELGHRESLALYKIGIKDKLFIINGKMRDIEFVNIGMIGFGLKKYEWTETFIQEYQQYLSKELKYFLIPLLHAYKANFQQNYKLVIELLSELNPVNQLHYLPKIKNLLIRAYFEGVLKGEEHYRIPLTYEIDSLKKMMHRSDKLSQIKTQSVINFLKLTKQLLALFSNKSYNLQKIQSFELLLMSTNPLILKHWLKAKIEEIKNTASF